MRTRRPTRTKADDRGAPPSAAEAEPSGAYAAWKAGTSLGALVGKYPGCTSRSATRKILTAAAGGKDAFRKLRAEGAGGTQVAFGGKRHVREAGAPLVDDTGVPRIRHTRLTKGWSVEWATTKLGKRPTHISPKGIRYVQAKPTEKADLIRYFPDIPSLADYRMRREETSGRKRAIAADASLVARGQAAWKAARAIKRAKRKARKRKGAL